MNCLLKALTQLFPPQLGLVLQLVTGDIQILSKYLRSSRVWRWGSGACRSGLCSSFRNRLTFGLEFSFFNSSLVYNPRIVASRFGNCAQSVCRDSREQGQHGQKCQGNVPKNTSHVVKRRTSKTRHEIQNDL